MDKDDTMAIKLKGGGIPIAVPTDYVGYWPMDEGGGTVAHDLSPNAFHGSISGAVWTAGRTGAGLYFDGIDDHVTVPHHPLLSITGDITVSLWIIFREAPTTWRGIVSKRGLAWQAEYGFNYHMIGLQWYFGYGNWQILRAPMPTLNVWHHLVGVRRTVDGVRTMEIWIDAVKVAEAAQIYTPAATTAPLSFGAGIHPGPEYHRGELDQLRIYARALTPTEIAALYGAGL